MCSQQILSSYALGRDAVANIVVFPSTVVSSQETKRHFGFPHC